MAPTTEDHLARITSTREIARRKRQEKARAARQRRRIEARKNKGPYGGGTSGFLKAVAPDAWGIPAKAAAASAERRARSRPGPPGGPGGPMSADAQRRTALALQEIIRERARNEGRNLTRAEENDLIALTRDALNAGYTPVRWRLGEKALEQIAESLLYTPAFLYRLGTDPIGTAKMIPGAIAEDFRHPLDNPGYLLMDLLGAKGIARGVVKKGARATRAVKAGKVGEAGAVLARPPVSGLRELAPGAYVPEPRGISHPIRATDRAIGRARMKTRTLVAAIDTAPAEALRQRAKHLDPAVGEAIRAAANNTPIEARIALYTEQLNAKKLTAYQRRRISQRLKAAIVARERGYLTDTDGTVRIAARHPEIQDLLDATRKESVATEALKIELGILDPEQAAARIDMPAEMFSPGEGRPGDFYLPGNVERTPTLGPPRIGAHTFGVPRNPFGRKAWTGEAERLGLTDPNPVKVAAETSMVAERLRQRHETWRQAKAESVTAEELVRRLRDDPRAAAEIGRHWRAVRLKAGTSTTSTRAMIDNLFRDDYLFGDRLDLGALQDLARDADASGQVRFFDNRRIRAETAKLRTNPSAIVKLADTLNSLAKISLLSLAGTAYIVPNVMGQAAMLLVEQMSRAPLELMGRAPLIVKKLTKGEKATMRAASGYGIAKGLAYEKGAHGTVQWAGGKLATGYGKLLDQPFRDAAFTYEAWVLGYTDAPAVKRLLNAKRGSVEHLDLIEIGMRVNRALGDFENLTPVEQTFVRRVVFFYPWIRASTEYAILRAPIDHPAKYAALAQGGRVAQEEQELMFGRLVAGILRMDLSDEDAVRAVGREAMDLLPPGTFLTPGGKAITPTAAAVLQGPSDLFEIATSDEPMKELLRQAPPAVGMIGAAAGFDTFRGDSYPPAAGNMWGRLGDQATNLSRWTRLYERLGETGVQEGRTFTYTPREAWAQALYGSQSPRGINPKTLADNIEEERRKGSRVTAKQTSAETVRQNLAAERRSARLTADRLKLPAESWPRVEAALAAHEKLELALARLPGRVTYRARAKAAAKVMIDLHPQTADRVNAALDALASGGATDEDYQGLYLKMREVILADYYEWHKIAERVSIDRIDMGW